MYKRIKKIVYQYLRSFNIEDLSDEERVRYAKNIIYPLIEKRILDKDLNSKVLGVDVNWNYGGTNDTIVEFVRNGFSIIKDLRRARKEDVGIRMPIGIKISWNEFDKMIKISWNEIKSAFGYRIIRDFNTSEEKIILDGSSGYKDEGGTLIFFDKVGDDNVHSYVVIPIASSESERYDVSFPKRGKAFQRLNVPTNLMVSKDKLKKAVEISWDKVPNAYGYTIKRDETVIAPNHKSTSYIDEVRDDKEHKYQVKSNGELKSADSIYTNAKKGKGYSITQPPENLKASFNKFQESIELSWREVENAKSYNIERDGKLIKSKHKGASYIDNVGDSENHTYRIASNGAVEEANSDYGSKFIGKGYSIAQKPKPSATYNKKELSIVISWDQTEDTTSYTIKRDSEIIKSDYNKTSFIDNVGDNKEHIYEVMSKGVVEGADSDYSDSIVGKGYIKTKKPYNISATSNMLEKAIEITWESEKNFGHLLQRDNKIIADNIIENKFIDYVNDGDSHSYRIMSKGEVSLASSKWSSVVNGRGYVKAEPVKNIQATYNKHDGLIILKWEDSKYSVGYTIKRNNKIIETNHTDNNYTDIVNDSKEHIYEIKSNGIVRQADSNYSTPVIGRSK